MTLDIGYALTVCVCVCVWDAYASVMENKLLVF